MKFWPRRSLVRRMVFTLLAAFLLVWAVLSIKNFMEVKHDIQNRDSLNALAHALLDSLEPLDEAHARIVMAASDKQYQQLRKQVKQVKLDDLGFVLETHDGRRVYTSPVAHDIKIPPEKTGISDLKMGTQSYWAVTQNNARWRLHILEPEIKDSYLLSLASTDLLIYLIIALPLILAPLWIAVRSGLQPLRVFAQQIFERAPDDFTPVLLRASYAELLPLAEAFNTLIEKTRHSIGRERAFVQDAAHELRTPLAVIATQAHVLAKAAGESERASSKLALEQAVARASHLVHQLLALAALEGAGMRDIRDTDLVALAREMLISITPMAMEKHIDIGLSSPESLSASLDKFAFHSILENLVNNALTYCQPGAQVSVALSWKENLFCLSVSDNGSGISQTDLPHVFDRFYRGRNTTERGSGLGLAIVRQAANTLMGSVDIQPGIDGMGVTFLVSWPGSVQDELSGRSGSCCPGTGTPTGNPR